MLPQNINTAEIYLRPPHTTLLGAILQLLAWRRGRMSTTSPMKGRGSSHRSSALPQQCRTGPLTLSLAFNISVTCEVLKNFKGRDEGLSFMHRFVRASWRSGPTKVVMEDIVSFLAWWSSSAEDPYRSTTRSRDHSLLYVDLVA